MRLNHCLVEMIADRSPVGSGLKTHGVKDSGIPPFEIRERWGTRRKIIYQGFSLLTANPEVLGHPLVTTLATRANVTPAQIVFAFARAVGMLPLTGTSNTDHMKQDLASLDLTLPPDAVHEIESLFG